jgi:hypothetical protein
MTHYKVWIEIEACDEDADTYDTVTPIDIGCSGSFDTLEEAEAFARALHEHRDESGTP